MPNRRNTLYSLLILSLLAGLFTGRAFFFNLSYLLGALLIISLIWSWTAVRWVGITRRTRTRRAQVGRNLEEVFVVTNRSILPKLWLEIRDHSNMPGHRASHIVPALGPRASYRWYVDTPCTVRGEFTLGPISISSGDPFGLFSSPRTLAATSRVIVYPRTVPVDHFELPMGVLSGGDAQRRRAQTITTNAAGVREYAPGDAFNRIHWATTARRERLMVKEFEIDPMVDVWMFVDFSADSLVEFPNLRRINGTGAAIPTNGEIPPSTEEYAVVIAASLAKHFIEAERALGFAAYVPHREIHQPERGNRQLLRILQSLAVARSFTTYSLAEMLTLETPYFTRGTTLVVITSSLDTRWIAEAQILARKGIRPVCVYIDPSSFGGNVAPENTRAMLRLAKIPTVTVSRGDDLTAALRQRPI
ncbi:MAG TPA: DUF58 domain-containing protein [Oceanobacillus sp.]|nr:DUF58 domain-containing protein [Oceanobacillus sp.]